MTIYGFKALQRKGKTACMVAAGYDIFHRYHIKPENVTANFHVNCPGARYLTNEGMRQFVADMVRGHFTEQLILIDEIDRVFPARFFADREQTETLIGLWQDSKLKNHILYTAHEGTAIDKIIRDSTNVVIRPNYDKKRPEIIPFVVLDGRNKGRAHGVVHDAYTVFGYYDTREVVL